MTEAEWLTCDDPERMRAFVWDGMSLRKRRLFAAGGARRSWGLLGDARSRRAVEVAERHADGLADDAELAAACQDADEAQFSVWKEVGGASEAPRPLPDWWYASLWAHWATGDVEENDYQVDELYHRGVPATAQADILRDLVPHPTSRLVPPAKVGADAGRLARHAYEARDWAALAVLADALEEDGCADARLLTHLRSPWLHVRGCWALDLVLGMG